MLFRHFNLNLGIHFAGGKHQAYFLRAGFQFQAQIQLCRHRGHIAGAGYVGLRFFIGFDQFGRFKTGDSITYNRNSFRCVGHGLGCRRGNGADKVNLIVYKTLGDGLQVGLIPLCILRVVFYVFAFHEAFFLHAFDETLAGIIECFMLYDLDDAYIIYFCRVFFRSFRFFISAAATGRSKGHHGQEHTGCQKLFAFKKHKLTLLSLIYLHKSMIQNQNAKVNLKLSRIYKSAKR